MIFGHISHIVANRYPKAIVAALDYLKQTDFDQLASGRYPLKGKSYVQVLDLTTSPEETHLPEVHRQYIDVQYWHAGMERMCVATDRGNHQVAESYDAERDILFYTQVENEQELLCRPGNFAVFFPEDAHRIACKENETSRIRKVVVKVAIDDLEEEQ
ncbi:YhcH/YjgK/YiaL family protein [Rodentibacter trehalosifermentans]|uniref:YhcH/YjgK/YiaL family protein n=1 Tax=Rodentibacter trehalosifermentans TaxID=1908263 RepID=UPI000984F410|nr:YhcH/YjgK/YiaL family protein [Rodentibacter trehalosifermentans]OOF52494.1 EbgC protein [Rodentibacter trehalosifermentans]